VRQAFPAEDLEAGLADHLAVVVEVATWAVAEEVV
jgi:hypothetical protein